MSGYLRWNMRGEACDRCGDRGAACYDGCAICGPIPLCDECRAIHIQERLDEASA